MKDDKRNESEQEEATAEERPLGRHSASAKRAKGGAGEPAASAADAASGSASGSDARADAASAASGVSTDEPASAGLGVAASSADLADADIDGAFPAAQASDDFEAAPAFEPLGAAAVQGVETLGSHNEAVGVKAVTTGHFTRIEVNTSPQAKVAGVAPGNPEAPAAGTANVVPKNAPRKRGKGVIVAAVVVIAAILAVAAYFLVPRLENALTGGVEKGQAVTITVTSGASVSSIANDLKEASVITSTRQFSEALEELGADTQVMPGRYTDFETGMTAKEAAQVLAAGPVAEETLTVPEGYSREQIAEVVGEQTHITAEEFLEASADASEWAGEYGFLADLGTSNLEGYLFPKTYEVTPEETAHGLVEQMLEQYATEISQIDFSAAEALGYSQRDIIIVASLVEKECPMEYQRADVASTIYNRLSIDMMLQLDSTVIYALGDEYTGEGYVSLTDLEVDSDYNTYKNTGLPPGPICNPGITAIQAAANPSTTDYLYFVNADIEGNFAFSSSYDEFVANKEAYEALVASQGQ